MKKKDILKNKIYMKNNESIKVGVYFLIYENEIIYVGSSSTSIYYMRKTKNQTIPLHGTILNNKLYVIIKDPKIKKLITKRKGIETKNLEDNNQ